MELKEEIIIAAVEAFSEKGLKFTMDDIAAILHISKKTIYKEFKNKEQLLHTLIDEAFLEIKKQERAIYDDESLTTVEKIRNIIIVLPVTYETFNYNQILELKNASPVLMNIVKNHLETGWELTVDLLERGMEEGVIRRVNIPILRTMVTASFEAFISGTMLEENSLSYQQALDEMMNILMKGLEIR